MNTEKTVEVPRNLTAEKENAWLFYKQGVGHSFGHKEALEIGFDAGVKAEQKRIKELLINTLELDVAEYLFPQEEKEND
jgi:hypothetical protein